MAECDECSKQAIIQVGRRQKHYCSEHFKRYFIANVRDVLVDNDVNGRLAVAVSGGKDSSACLHALSHLDGIDLNPFFVDLGIEEYSRKSLVAAEECTDFLGLDLDVIDLENRYGKSIPDLNEDQSGKPCSICGTVKRYIMNRYAWENDFDHVITGHTLSDEVSSTFNNLANVYLTPFRGLGPVLEENEDYRLAGRAKPLYFLKDGYCTEYVEEFNVPHTSLDCHFSKGSKTEEMKEWLHRLDSDRPGILRNFAKSFIRIEEMMEREREELGGCDNCGYPTSTGVCKFCRMIEISSGE